MLGSSILTSLSALLALAVPSFAATHTTLSLCSQQPVKVGRGIVIGYVISW